MKKPHFFSLVPHLIKEAGHFFEYHQCVENAVKPYVASFKLFMHREAKLPNCPMHWIPFFNDKAPVFHHKRKWFGKSYRHILKHEGDHADRRIFLCEQLSFVNALHFIFAFQFYCRPTDEFWLILRHDFDSLKFRGIVRQTIYRYMHYKIKDRLKLFVDSRLLQQAIGARLHLPIHVLPIPHTNIPPTIRAKQRSSTTLRCYWAGPPRLTKGWDHIRHVLSLNTLEGPIIELAASIDASLVSSNIKIIALPSVLSNEQYWQEMINCDVLLLPYHSSMYRYSTSGVFVEGIVAGKIPVVFADTWMADELKRFHLQELIVDWKNPNFWSNIVHLAKDPCVEEKLSQMRQEYRKFHSADHFAACLTKMF